MASKPTLASATADGGRAWYDQRWLGKYGSTRSVIGPSALPITKASASSGRTCSNGHS
jgi:hypothetical protein